MVAQIFVPQLDGCSYVSGGFNCSAASGAMWLYRTSRGRVKTNSCNIRRLTGDRSGGLNLDEIRSVMVNHYGITAGRLYRPMKFGDLVSLLQTGRYGAILQGGYKVIRPTQFDASRHNFTGGHAMYATWANGSSIRIADPLADGRYSGCPKGYQSYPISLIHDFANALPLGRGTLATEYAPGYVYAYLTPKDPLTYRLTVGSVWLHTEPNTKETTRIRLMPQGTRLAVIRKVWNKGTYYKDSKPHTNWLKVRHPSGVTGFCAAAFTKAA